MSEQSDWEYRAAADQKLPFKDRLKSEQREVGLAALIGHGICRAVVRAYLQINHAPKVLGAENLPKETPFVLVANHTSHLDALALVSLLPSRFTGQVFALAAGDTFFTSPGKSLFAGQIVNALPVWRGKPVRHAIEHLQNRLEHRDCGYVLFPEGTRSRTGEMNRFKPGVGMLVAGKSIPVLPCHLSGAFEAWPPDCKFPQRGRMTIRIGGAQFFEGETSDRPGWKRIAERLEKAVAEMAQEAEEA